MSTLRVLVVGFAVLAAVIGVRAQTTFIWTGGADPNANFTTAGNWSPSLPSNNGTADVLFNSNLFTNPVVDANYSIHALTFAAGAATSINLKTANSATLTIQSSLTQNSVANETISVPLILGSAFSFVGPGSGQGFVNINGGLTAANGFTSSGGMYLGIGGAWNVTGAVSLSGIGTVIEFTSAARTLANNFAVNSGANLTFNAGANVTTINGVISGTGAVNFSSPVTLNAANTYTGQTSIGPAAVTIATPNALPTGSTVSLTAPTSQLLVNQNQTVGSLGSIGGNGSAVIAATRTLTVTGNSSFSGAISGAGGLALSTASGGINLTLTGANTYSGGTTIGPNTTLQLGLGAANVGGTTGSIPSGNIIDNGALFFAHSDNISYGGISGSGSVSQGGAGTLTLTGTNTYGGLTGTTQIQAGILTDGADGAFSPNSTILVASGAMLAVTGNETIRALGDFSGGGGSVTLTGGKTLTLSNNGSTFSGAISGGGSLVLSTGVFETLTGANTYGGGTTINTGATLQLGNGNTSGSVAGNIANNGALQVNRSNAVTLPGNISGSGTLSVNSGGTLTLSGANSFSGNTTINVGTLADGALGALSPNSGIFFFNGASSTLNVNFNETISGLGGVSSSIGSTTNLASGVVLTIKPTGLTYAGAIAGATGSLVLNGTGTQALAGANTYGGGTTINSGAILQIGASGVNAGTTGSITGNVADSGTLIFARFDNLTFGGVISGSGTLVQNGAGVLTLTGANSYTGTTTISGTGTVKIGDGGTTGSIAGNVSLNGGTLAFNHSDAVTFASLITGNGNLSQIGPGTLTLTGSNNFSGATNISSGAALQIGNGGTTGSLFGNIVDNGTLITNRSDNLTLGGSISGTGDLIKRGTGTLTLGNSLNSYSGNTTIEAGVLAVNSLPTTGPNPENPALRSTAVPGGSSTIVIGNGATGATLRYTGNSSAYSDRPIQLAGTTGGATLDISSSGSLTLAGSVSATTAGSKTLTLTGNSGFSSSLISGAITNGAGTLSLLKTGFSTWELSGSNAYTGGTIINGGTLRISGSNSLPVGGDVVINATNSSFASLEVSANQTIGALTFGGASGAPSNGLDMQGKPTLTLGGTVTYLSNTGLGGGYISGGTLDLGAATRTFSIGHSPNAHADFTVYSDITGIGVGIVKQGTGTLALSGNNTFTGGLTLSLGTVLVGRSNAAGTGVLTLASGTTLGAYSASSSSEGPVVLNNPITLNSGVTFGTATEMGSESLQLNGIVTASALNTTVHLSPDTDPVLFTGTFQGAAPGTTVTFDSGGAAVFGGTIDGTVSSLIASGAGLLFATPAGVPGTGTTLQATNHGYVGVIATEIGAPPTAASVLARITDKGNFSGTFGFDTHLDSVGSLHNYEFTADAPLDLRGFGANLNFTLGSLSGAMLSGPAGSIIPSNIGYAFGNGGGVLLVAADLNGNYPLSVISAPSPDNSLAVVFSGNNSFTGNVTVANSLALLDSASALPASASVSLGSYGYIGATEMAFTGPGSFASFASRISGYTASSVLGFDSHTVVSNWVNDNPVYAPRVMHDPINLASFGPISLGTATQAIFAGPIIAPNAAGANKNLTLVAVGKRADLTIASPLLTGNVSAVTFGSATAPWDNGTVHLVAPSNYTGGTLLAGGTLVLQTSSKLALGGATVASGPLGTGTLTVAANARNPILGISDFGSGVTLHNAIALAGALQVGEPSFDGGEVLTEVAGGDFFSQFTLAGVISGAGGLDLFRPVALLGANTFTGGVRLNDGTLTLGTDSALGASSGTFVLNSFNGSLGLIALGARTLANPIVFNGGSDASLYVGGTGSLTFTGPVMLAGSLSVTTGQYPFTLNGSIGGFGSLEAAFGGAPVYVNNSSNTYSGGTHADYRGTIIFGSAASIPANGLLSAVNGGYIGVASTVFATDLQTNFLNRFDKFGTSGTIGFDTATSAGTPNTFSGPINLSFFNGDAQLGSASRAILSGAITPQSNSYNFGGGGGLLQVTSALVNSSGGASRDLRVNSNGGPALTVRLASAGNSYTGGAFVFDSALVFAAGALPAGVNNFFLGSDSYIGTEDTNLTNVSAFLGHFFPQLSSGTIGFDAAPGGPSSYTISGNLDLSRFTALNPTFYIGSTTSLIFGPTASITMPTNAGNYRFVGYKGGSVEVDFALTNAAETARGVVIGEQEAAANTGGVRGRVTLAGNNTYTFGTTLYAGELYLGSDSALGAGGTLTIAANPNEGFGPRAALFASGGTRTLTNPIMANADFDAGGAFDLTLNGTLSGSGELYKVGSGTLTLGGANGGFSGDIYVQQGNLTLGQSSSNGSGALLLGGPLGPSVTFLDNATVYGIAGDNAADRINLGTGKTLTVNQPGDSEFLGFFLGSNASIIYQPYTPSLGVLTAGTSASSIRLRLAGSSSYGGSTTINGGITVIAANNNAFGPGSNAANTVVLNGGKLAVESGVTISNPLTLTSGTLGGAGTFQPPATLRIQGGVTLAPGLGNPATLTFNDSLPSIGPVLQLASGGTYRWQLQDAAGTAGLGWDTIAVNGVVDITASSASMFNFKLTTIDLTGNNGLATNFNANQSYSWTVLTATSITGFTANQFNLGDTSLFLNSIGNSAGLGTFSVSLNGASTSLLLNFTPAVVPEPSTYVLLTMGAGALGFTLRRRRRISR